MIYRTNALEQTLGPQFSFVEKMFMSGKKVHRALGHTILLVKELGRWLVVIGVVLIFMALVGGAIWLIIAGLSYVYSLLVNHNYSSCEAAAIISVVLLSLIILLSLIKMISDLIEENSKFMKERIAAKINKYNDNNESETT